MSIKKEDNKIKGADGYEVVRLKDGVVSKVVFQFRKLHLVLFTILVFSLFLGSLLYLMHLGYNVNYLDSSNESGNVSDKKELLQLNDKIIELEDSLYSYNLYLKALSNVVSGKVKVANVDSLIAKQSPVLLNDISLQPSKEDSIFRAQIAQDELEDIELNSSLDRKLFFSPVRGIITSSYDISHNHLATDIAAPKGEDIKSIDDGTVIFTSWTPDIGNVIIIQHKNQVVSVYKHCSQIFHKIGDEVEKGDVIASVGNGGELTTGPHLHFELWIQGNAVNAEEYIGF